MDMRAGTETAMARVIAVFGAAQPHCAYLFANRRATRIKVLVHDGFSVWLAARRLTQGKFHWPSSRHGTQMEFSPEQLQAHRASLAETWIYRSSPYALEDMADRHRDEGQSKSAP